MVFPVEMLSRELDGKLLLALCAKERGWRSIIGGLDEVNDLVHRFEPCVYFAKSARSSNAQLFARLRSLGHQVIVLDEEALVRHDNIFLMKHERNAFKNVDLLLTWGEDSRAMWLRSGFINDLPAAAVGNPRIDMLTPQLRPYHQENIASIRSRYGNFVLFNSNFGMVNNTVTGGVRFNLARWTAGGRGEKDSVGYLAHKRQVFERFCVLIPKLAAAISPRNLVIRPHPNEDHTAWKSAVADAPNAHVIFEGSVVPWIAAARVLVHNGCTSAVEAAVVGTPVVTYRPVTSEFDNALANSMGIECCTDEGLLSAVGKTLAESRHSLSASQMDLLRHHVAFADGSMCSNAILDAIERTPVGMAERGIPLHRWLNIYLQHHRELLPKRLRKLSRGSKRNAYKKLKFSGLNEEMITSRIGQLAKVLSRFSGIQAHETGKNLVELK